MQESDNGANASMLLDESTMPRNSLIAIALRKSQASAGLKSEVARPTEQLADNSFLPDEYASFGGRREE